jgi:uncharacterized protein
MSGIERVCISVNSVCNLKCTYCYFFLQPDQLPGPDAMTAEEIGVILAQAQRYALRPEADKRIKVNFVGSGEPLLAWPAIRTAIAALNDTVPDHRLRFYTVTNGLLLNPTIVAEMKSIGLSPSVSLDGPAWLHDRTRLRHNGRGSHADVMRGIAALRDGGVPVAINTTLTRDVIAHLDAYFDFVEAQGFTKLIFGRLVDVPTDAAVSTGEFYAAIRHIAEIITARGLEGRVEVGNLEAYRRALAGRADRVCTMFGSTCGSGFHNIIYMQRDVYPCGRMFGQDRWKLGRYDEPLERFPERMARIVGAAGCTDGSAAHHEEPAGTDCLIERESPGYDAAPRGAFVRWFGTSTQMASALVRRPETAG